MKTALNNSDYSKRLVAFIDILGFKKLILQNKSKSLKSIIKIDGNINHVISVLRDTYGKSFSTKLFSDCICVSCESTPENMMYILYELSFIQLYLSLDGIFIRGALSEGNHFENDHMIFSRGLVKAYKLQNNALYPRIIVDKSLITRSILDGNYYFPSYIQFQKRSFLIQAPDGYFFVDYLNMLHEEGFEQIVELQNHKKEIIKAVRQNQDNIEVLEKYKWLSEYHNLKINDFIDSSDYNNKYANDITNKTKIDILATFPYFKKPK